MDTIKLNVGPRTVLGKNVKKLRRQGIVPANVYGGHESSTPVQLSERQIDFEVARASRSALYSFEVAGQPPVTALVKEIHRHPTSGRALHVDFQRLTMSEKLRATVPLHFIGESYAVERLNGTLLHNLTSVDVECLPSDLPTSLTVDISPLGSFDAAIHVRDIPVPDGVDILTPADEIVANLSAPRIEAGEETPAPAEAPAVAAPAQES
ncbi:MAG: 50S ribosomal protein L25 [Chloroflexi bacterium]|nr:50S ribosomal protein L25 [Chloroflexota bacterium]